MESFVLVLNKAAKMIAPFKAIQNRVVVLAALTDVFIEHGFSLDQALILSVKAYEIDLDELEEAENDQAEWAEMTGTTPQDLYIERNSYAIAQSERYEQFRNEY